jgi:DHA2 family multidrug resistance protein
MIPQLLQELYGYRAIDAGLVLGPGAFVITMLAPVGAQLLQRRFIQPRFLLFTSALIVGLSFLYYGHFNLDTDYSHYAWARALQGLGYAFFFVPLSMIAYSELKPSENNKASSLTNFFRNWGGSFGVALVNTVTERRLSFHQSTVGANLPASSSPLQDQVARATAFLETRGFAPADAARAAYARVYEQLQAQAHLLAFMDCFHLIGWLTLLAAPLILLTRAFRMGGGGGGGH